MKITYFHLQNFYDNQYDIIYILQALILSPNTIFHNLIFTVLKSEISVTYFNFCQNSFLNMDFQ